MLPCELVVSKLLPTIRKMLVIKMLKEKKKQREIAKELRITEGAVSHYLSKRRAGTTERLWNKIVKDALDEEYNPNKIFEENVCAVCKNLRKNGNLCIIHLGKKYKREGRNKIENISECKICMSACQ